MKDLEYIFRPKSVAVIGASGKKGTIGREVLHNIIVNEFNGKVFPVNPNYSVVHSIKCYSTILDVPDAVDLAIVIVPRKSVPKVAEQCGHSRYARSNPGKDAAVERSARRFGSRIAANAPK